MTCQEMSCVFDSSGGAFPNGYCIWEKVDRGCFLISCHCQVGFCCGEGPGEIAGPIGLRIKWPCDIKK
ncbi:MAG: hypothetical protein H8E44_47240 [Planctomycetes bacterium]|nr:hypothetical protein [Planctomycetota bacterium]